MGIDAWNLDWIERIRKRTKLNRKEDVLDVFVQNQKNLARIQLDPSDVDTEQAFRDAIREDVTLNRIKFIGENRMSAFVAAVKQIASQHQSEKEQYLKISDQVVRSCSRTSSGADSYFYLDKIFGDPALVIKPRTASHPPIDVVLGLTKPHILKCRIRTMNLFGLYRHTDIDAMSYTNASHPPPSWVDIDTMVVETIEFHLVKHLVKSHRYLSIRTPEPAPAISTEIDELF